MGGEPMTEELIPVLLTPVRVFGATGYCPEHPDNDPICPLCSGTPRIESCYGLSDATSPWSDCNRADGHIFRVDDEPSTDPERVQIRVYVPASELAKLREKYAR